MSHPPLIVTKNPGDGTTALIGAIISTKIPRNHFMRGAKTGGGGGGDMAGAGRHLERFKATCATRTVAKKAKSLSPSFAATFRN